jgi:hypothetical protein
VLIKSVELFLPYQMKTNRSLAKFLSRNLIPILLYTAGIAVALFIIPILIKKDYIATQIAVIALSTTLFLGYLNYQHTQDRLFKDLFKEFNERYNALSDQFQHLENDYPPEVKLSEVDKKDLKLIINYLNLCAEEYFWFDRGRLDYGAWESWKSGMSTWAKLPVVRVVFEDEVATWKTAYYSDFNTFFKELL